MERKSDKLLRDKLKGMEYPFDARAWNDMEAMLEGKKKKRGFVFWWLNGFFALALLGAGGYFFLQKNEPAYVVNHESEFVQTETSHKNASAKNDMDNFSSKENIVASENIPEQEINASINPAFQSNSKPPSASNNAASAENNFSGKNSANLNNVGNSRLTTQIGRTIMSAAKNHSQETALGFSASEEISVLEFPVANISEENNSTSENIVSENATEIVLNENEIALQDSINMNTLAEDEPNAKKEKDKKMKFQYSLGAVSYVGMSVVENNVFVKPPSWSIGIANEFMFFNRVSLSTAVSYAQTNFGIKNPSSHFYNPAPLSYTCHISELNILLGLKGYAVSNEKFRFYFHAGFQKHIRLKETFDYVMPKEAPPVSFPNTPSDNFSAEAPPQNTTFGSSNYESASHELLSGGGGQAESTSDFSINYANRNYSSFYVGSGVEFIAKEKWIFFAEPGYHHIIHLIGTQELRKRNVGLFMGMRVGF